MNEDENIDPAQPGDTPPPPAPPPGYIPDIPPEEIEAGKSIALLRYILCLLGFPFWLYPIIVRDNAFSLYHAKQCLMLWIASAVLWVAGSMLTVVCIGFLILPAALVLDIIWIVKGIINSNKGQAVPLPIIGKWAVDLFKGITKAPKA